MQYKYIFFDLDGTLTDPGIGITNSVMYALDKFGIHADRENLYCFIGPPLVDSFMEFYGFPEDKARKAVEYYREYFSVTGLFENKVYDGMEDVLDKLKLAGHKLYVATSKPKVYADRILERFDLKKYFEYVAGADLEGHKSSKSDVVKEAMEISHASSDKILMIGDRKHDIIHFLRREMLDFTAFPVFFVSNLLLVQRKKYYFNRATVSRNCSIVL